MAMRKASAAALNGSHLAGPNDRIAGIILDREHFRTLFGPTVFARPEFFEGYVWPGAAAAALLKTNK